MISHGTGRTWREFVYGIAAQHLHRRPHPCFHLYRRGADEAGSPPLIGGQIASLPLRDLERLSQRYADKGVTVVAIDEGETAQVVSNFIKDHGITFPVLLDPSLAYWDAYVTIGIPLTMFVDQGGRIVRKFQGETTTTNSTRRLEPSTMKRVRHELS